jgi:drug/metabolite transporter (DMT)-like permease
MDSQKTGFRIEYVLMLITAFFWAAGHLLGRIIVQEVHPFQLGTVTLGTGFIGVFIFLAVSGKIRNIKKISLKDILISLGIGVFGFFLYQILTFTALVPNPGFPRGQRLHQLFPD